MARSELPSTEDKADINRVRNAAREVEIQIKDPALKKGPLLVVLWVSGGTAPRANRADDRPRQYLLPRVSHEVGRGREPGG